MLLSALALPLRRRRPWHGPPVRIAGLYGIAVGMAVAVAVTWEAIVGAVSLLDASRHRPAVSIALGGHGFFRLPMIAASALIMVLVIAIAEALLHLGGVKPTPTPPPIPSALPAEAPPSDPQSALLYVPHDGGHLRSREQTLTISGDPWAGIS